MCHKKEQREESTRVIWVGGQERRDLEKEVGMKVNSQMDNINCYQNSFYGKYGNYMSRLKKILCLYGEQEGERDARN